MGKSSIKSDIKPKGELYLPPKGYPPINRGGDIPPIREEYNKSPLYAERRTTGYIT